MSQTACQLLGRPAREQVKRETKTLLRSKAAKRSGDVVATEDDDAGTT